MTAARHLTIDTSAAPHGTRARYVGAKCRCADCRQANTGYVNERNARIAAARSEIIPTGPPGDGTQVHRGIQRKIKTCPGANGAPCVRGGTWLRGQVVCTPCVDRALVWDGLVPAGPARAHLMRLRRAGVGYNAVNEACDVARTVLTTILSRKTTQIRRSTERKILAVDAGARKDAAVVTARKMNRQIAELRAAGFTLRHLGRLMGYDSGSQVLQLGDRPKAIARTVHAVGKLYARFLAGDLSPESPLVDATPALVALDELRAIGLTDLWLSGRLGFAVHRKQRPRRMWSENVKRVLALRAEIEELKRDGLGLPDGWQAKVHKIGAAFGFEGGWSFDARTSKKKRSQERRELEQLARSVAS